MTTDNTGGRMDKAKDYSANRFFGEVLGGLLVAPAEAGLAWLAAYAVNLTALLPAIAWWQVVLLRFAVRRLGFAGWSDEHSKEYPVASLTASALVLAAAVFSGAS